MLDNLPDSANVWIYTASRTLSSAEIDTVLESLRAFFDSWESHGRTVIGDADFVGGRFLIVGAHIEGGDISGCGIDASTRAVSIVETLDDVRWIGNLNVAYRGDDDQVDLVDRSVFRKLVSDGTIVDTTQVFDLSLTRLADFRNGKFELPFSEAWHSTHFVRASTPNA